MKNKRVALKRRDKKGEVRRIETIMLWEKKQGTVIIKETVGAEEVKEEEMVEVVGKRKRL